MTSARDLHLISAFAAEVRARRQLHGFSQEELAWQAGVDRSFIARLESCRNQPSLSVVFAIAKALHAKPHELIESTHVRYLLEQSLNSHPE
jgi:transcriptional regulator with XRE-family HTH domain